MSDEPTRTNGQGSPRAPAGLGAAGKRLWRAVVGGFLLRDDEREVLAAACRLADEIVRLEEELADAAVMVAGSKGQDRPNPLFAELRSHRLAMGRLLTQLGLADAGDVDGTAASSAGRRMARARWSRRGQ